MRKMVTSGPTLLSLPANGSMLENMTSSFPISHHQCLHVTVIVPILLVSCSFEMASKLVFLPPVTSTSEPSSPPFHRLIYVNISHSHLKLFGGSQLHSGSKPNSSARPVRCSLLLLSDLPNCQYPLCSSTTKLLVSPLLSLSLCTFAHSELPLPAGKEASSCLRSPVNLGLLPPL